MISIWYFERTIVNWLTKRYQRHTVRRAISHAYRVYAHQPGGRAVPFDEYFVLTYVAPLLQRALVSGEKVTPFQVAEAWARHVSILPSSRQQLIAATTPAAADFLFIVADTFAQRYAGQNSPLLVETSAMATAP
jgi:hypothetical protein